MSRPRTSGNGDATAGPSGNSAGAGSSRSDDKRVTRSTPLPPLKSRGDAASAGVPAGGGARRWPLARKQPPQKVASKRRVPLPAGAAATRRGHALVRYPPAAIAPPLPIRGRTTTGIRLAVHTFGRVGLEQKKRNGPAMTSPTPDKTSFKVHHGTYKTSLWVIRRLWGG